jgi:transcriptional regulator with XRE-family HTH domain
MFVSRLRAIRKKKNWTQKFLAQKANLTQVTICNIENNKKDTKFHTIEALADALGIYAYDLFVFECKDFIECKNLDKKQFDCYAKGKCAKYNNIQNTLYLLVFCRFLFYDLVSVFLKTRFRTF